MKITVLNGSPRKGNTAKMCEIFAESAREAGHEVEVLHVGKMKIGGCLGCEYCHTKGEGKCVQKDDMDKVIPAYLDAEIIVYASPIYYSGLTAQLCASIQRMYAIGKPPKAKKAALLLSSGVPHDYKGAIDTYREMVSMMQIEDAGVISVAGLVDVATAKVEEIRSLAKTL